MIDDTTAATPPSTLSSDERTWALLGHLAAFSAFFTAGFGCVLGPLVVWLVKRDSLPFAADQAREAVNFNLTALIVWIGLWIITIGTFGIGIFLTLPLGLALLAVWIVLTIVAAINANNGQAYRYPLTLRLIK